MRSAAAYRSTPEAATAKSLQLRTGRDSEPISSLVAAMKPEAGFDRRPVPTAVLVRRHESATFAASRAVELQNDGKSLRFGQRGGGASG